MRREKTGGRLSVGRRVDVKRRYERRRELFPWNRFEGEHLG